MNPQKALRSYLLIAGLGISGGLLLNPAQEGASDTSSDTEWSLPEYPENPFGAGAAADVASIAWWGVQSDSLTERNGGAASAVTKRKVAWHFKGVVSVAGKRYALIAEEAKTQPQRYLPGDALPGGERLEIIDDQGIRFSLPDEGGDQERKLYVPAE